MNTRVADDPQAEFHRRIGGHGLAALWVARRGMDLTRPKSPARPALWRYGDIRPDIMEAGALITAEDAFRRVLVLENPAFRGEMRVTNTLYAGLQLVRPGEIAPCHRHSQTAFRFVVEGTGAFTVVDGERTALHPGDFVITPQWSWHDHANEGDVPVVWLDVLDTPLVDFLDTVFREIYPQMRYPVSAPDDVSPARFGAGLLPDGAPPRAASPVFNYRYEKARAALASMAREGAWDACHALRLRYAHPQTGGHVTPTMAAHLQLMPAGFKGADYRATDGAVFCVMEGHGRTVVDGTAFEWGPRDIVVVPGWHRHRHEAASEAVLFSVSDQAAQQALGLWREERFDSR
jgi:gentisate 1,2-dioxygenase